MTKDNIQITADPYFCAGALTDTGFTPPAAIAYNSVGSSVTITNSYTEIFLHTKTTDCPVSTCSLKEPGCLSPLSA